MRASHFAFFLCVALVGNGSADSLHVRLVGFYADSLARPAAYSGDVRGDYAYYLGQNCPLTVLSIVDPSHPFLVGKGASHSEAVGSVFVLDDFLYAGSSLLHIFSVADPAHPVKVGSSSDSLAASRGLAVNGGYAYVACDSQGLRVISVADPTNPVDVARYDMPGLAYEVVLVGNYAYVANMFDGLRVLSIVDPLHPTEVGYLHGSPAKMAIAGEYAYVYDTGSDAFEVISIADPAHPREVGRLTGVAGDVAVDGSYAYVLDVNQAMLRVVSIGDPTHLVEVGHYALDPQFWSLDAARGYTYAGSTDGFWILKFYLPGDLDVDNDSLDVAADTVRLRGAGSYARGEFVLANTSASYNPDTADGPSVSVVDSVHFTGSLSGPGGTLDSIIIPNLPATLAEGQVVICTLAVFTPPGLRDGDYTGLVVVAGKDTAGFVIVDTLHALVRKLGDLDVDSDSLDVVADTIRLRGYGPYARSVFVLANTSALYNPDTSDGPSRSPVDSLGFSGSLNGPGGTIDSMLIRNLPASLAQGQSLVCTLAVYVPPEMRDGIYSGSITVTGVDSVGVRVYETFYARIENVPGDLDIDNDSMDIAGDTMNLHAQPAGPVYHPYAKAEFMLVNTSSTYNPDTSDGPSQSPLQRNQGRGKGKGTG